MQQDPNDELLNLTFYATPSHSCSYLPNKQATTVFLDPEKHISQKLYSRLSESGFRRSGSHVYKPHCDGCSACIPVRIPVEHFQASKTQKRCRKKGGELNYSLEKAQFSNEHYELYQKYIETRHADGDMYPPSPQQYREFLLSEWANTEFLTFYHDEKLVICAVIDRLDNGLSAVYTYFDPDYEKWSPGRLAILTLVEVAKSQKLDFVYLGYLVKNCTKMKYKSEYRPLDCLIGNRWIRLN